MRPADNGNVQIPGPTAGKPSTSGPTAGRSEPPSRPPSAPFRTLLQGRRGGGGGAGSELPLPAGLARPGAVPAAWIRPDGPTRPGRPAVGVDAVNAVRGAERVLVGRSLHGVEARIQITEGALAGSEIALRAVGGAVDAVHVVASSEASRQTLLAAVGEVSRRLRMRGIVLREPPAPGRGTR